MAKRASSGLNEQLQKHADQYLKETGRNSATTQEFAVWAVKNGKWFPPTDLILKACRRDFAKALREQHIVDDHGRPVRAKHVARISQAGKAQYLWADIREAPRKHMEVAFTQRREQIVGDCRQLKRDLDYYNDHHREQKAIQKCFDFTDDVAEGEFDGTI